MNVRRLDDREDVRGLVRVHARAWREAYDGLLPDEVLDDLSPDPSEEEIDQWEEQLRENQAGILVAVEDGTVRGFADFRWGDADTKAFVGSGEAGLRAIYVDPDHWHEGTGTELYEHGLDLLPEWIETVRLEVFAANDRARSFYEARGFEKSDESEYEVGGEPYPTCIYALGL